MESARNRLFVIVIFLAIFLCSFGQSSWSGRKIVIGRISFQDSVMQECIDSVVHRVIQNCSIDKEREVICMCFPNQDTDLLFFPKDKKYGLTEWFFDNHPQIVGYFLMEGYTIIVFGDGAYKYSIKKRGRKKLKILPINEIPVLDGVYPYCRVSIKDLPRLNIEESSPRVRPNIYY